jgi:hypothetical protein
MQISSTVSSVQLCIFGTVSLLATFETLKIPFSGNNDSEVTLLGGRITDG